MHSNSFFDLFATCQPDKSSLSPPLSLIVVRMLDVVLCWDEKLEALWKAGSTCCRAARTCGHRSSHHSSGTWLQLRAASSIASAQGGSERRTHGSSWDGPNTHATRAGPPSPFGWWLQATVVGAGTPNTHVDRRTHAHSARILIGGNGAAVRWRRRITAAVVGAGTRAPRSRPHGARVLALGSGWRMHGACWCACARP